MKRWLLLLPPLLVLGCGSALPIPLPPQVLPAMSQVEAALITCGEAVMWLRDHGATTENLAEIADAAEKKDPFLVLDLTRKALEIAAKSGAKVPVRLMAAIVNAEGAIVVPKMVEGLKAVSFRAEDKRQ